MDTRDCNYLKQTKFSHDLLWPSVTVQSTLLLYVCANIVVTASNYGVETEALFKDPVNHQLDYW